MKKTEQIEIHKAKPFEVGDHVRVKAVYTEEVTNRNNKRKPYTETVERTFKSDGKILTITEDEITITSTSARVPLALNGLVQTAYAGHEQFLICKKELISYTFQECGANPFCPEKRRINFYAQDIQSLLYKTGWGRDDSDASWRKINFDPFVIDKNGDKQYYQRGLVWALQQKQLLIDSIYNDIEIGKFLLRYNSWERMEKNAVDGQMHSWDCVDGKQRYHAILDFVNNKFPDSYGNYWEDLSEMAQRRFLNFGNATYGELPESATDSDVIDNFLTLNFTGVPMSLEHIEFVKSIRMK
jgi:hypothetical protein